MSVLWVTGEFFDGLRAVELAARGRLDRPAQSDPFRRLDWFKRVAEHSGSEARPLVVRARAGQAEAWLLLARTRPNRASALTSDHAQRVGPVFSGDPDEQLKRTLLRAAARRLGTFGMARISIDPVLPEDAALMRQGFAAAGWAVRDRAGPANFLLDVGGRHFEDYWESCSATLHEQVAAGGRHLNVEIADLVTSRLWEEVELIGGSDTFLRDLVQDATLDRSLRLAIARIGDAPVAAQIWTIEEGRAFAHWRIEDREAQHVHPSAQLTASVLRYLINVDHAQSIDFGNGSEAELAGWADERRVLRRLDFFNPRALSSWMPAIGVRATGLIRRAPLD